MMLLSEAMGGAPFRLGDLLDWPADRYPNRAAIIHTAEVSFVDLRDRAKQRASELARVGIGRFQRWGVLADNSAEFFVTLFALAQLGAVAAPIQSGRSSEWLTQAVARSGLSGILAPVRIPLGSVDPPDGLRLRFSIDGAINVYESWHPIAHRAGGPVIDVDPALIVSSSGSTRTPRGVVLSHGSVLTNIRSNIRALGLRDNDRTMVVLPVAHAYALIHQCLCHLSIGATICCPPQPLFATSLCRQLEKLHITTLVTVPAMLKIVVEGLRATGRTCPELRLVTVGAGRVNHQTMKQAMELLPAARFAITYGLTEAGPRVATNFVSIDSVDTMCVGVPLPNVEVVLEPLSNGGTEVCVRGSAIKRSYSDEPWQEGSDKKLCTTDLGEMRDGMLYVRGRLGRSINRGGVLYSPEAIESALLAHPDITAAVVRAEAHPFWGEVPVATLILREGATITVQDIRQFCSSTLSSAEIPARFDISNGAAPKSIKEQQMLILVEEAAADSTPAARLAGETL